MSSKCRDKYVLENPLFNKGTAFTREERRLYGLLGLLPPHVETLEQQVRRVYEAFLKKAGDMERHIFLRSLQDTNETLFYRLVDDHLSEMMPIIYTPVVGAACQKFSEIYRRPRGLFIPYPERDYIDEMLANAMVDDVRVIVVTDGERILGLGDQGAGGMGISIGKLSLYTACGGIDPSCTLPVLLDAGTNNADALQNPLYIGWRNKRVTGQAYDDFVDLFVQAVKRRWPEVLLQFEDFAKDTASPLLERYRDQLCVFNDDIQGTASVAVGTLFSALKQTGEKLGQQNILFVGAGSAGCGIAEQLVATLSAGGMPDEEARSRIFMAGQRGLLHDGTDGLLPFQQRFVQPQSRLRDWTTGSGNEISVMDIIRNARPTVLIGVSGQPGLFTQELVTEMAGYCERPVIFPLSNPTSRAEAVPADLYRWTNGRALVATGSPFPPVELDGVCYPVSQSNNSYIFPGLGLGVLASGARRISDGMLMAASVALGEYPRASDCDTEPLLPSLDEIRQVSRYIARAVGEQAQTEGLADEMPGELLADRIEAISWRPEYSRPDLPGDRRQAS
ncbi:MAG: NAD-dependent malic enzyme [Gammaproteobacteria bacterium]|nr:NAD-dependent malic enzyme [Gammaproteobacteria bacterium]